jgi:histone deacetylase 1/2
MRCESQGQLYPITNTTANKTSLSSEFAALSTSIWHDRLGHPGASILDSLRKNKMIECIASSKLNSTFCTSCPLGKHIKMPFIDSDNFSFMPFDILHSDVWTSPVLSTSGHKYYVLFLDDHSNFLWTFPISHKSQVFPTFEKLRAYIKTQFHREVKNIQCDNGREYDNGNFQKLCETNGISFRFSCPHTSSQNGKAERKIRSINNIIRTLLVHASLPPNFWHHALQMATYLLNILPNKKLNYQSPLKILFQKVPSYSHLRVFGCLCYPLFPSPTINKLQSRSIPCVFLGYPSNHRGYKCYDLSQNKIILCRHVIFNESEFPFSKLHTPNPETYQFLDDELSPYIINHLLTQPNPTQQTHIPNPAQTTPPTGPNFTFHVYTTKYPTSLHLSAYPYFRQQTSYEEPTWNF